MKNSNLLIIVTLALVAGYFAYPYFNPTQTISNEEQKALSSKMNETPHIEVKSSQGSVPNNDLIDNYPIQSDNTISKPSREAEIKNPIIQPDYNSTNEESFKKLEASGSKTLTGGQVIDAQTRDFSYYKLKPTPNIVSISRTDPRIVLLQGTYNGALRDWQIEMVVGKTESSIKFYNSDHSMDETRSFSAANEIFFSNVHSNGNLITIKNDKISIGMNIKSWPNLRYDNRF